MNILVIGICSNEVCELIVNSKLCSKFYITSDNRALDYPKVEYSSLKELALKSQALEIDVAILFDYSLVEKNIYEIFKSYRLNLFAVNSKWFNLQTNFIAVKNLLNYYQINTPKIIKAPVNFPLVFRTNDSSIKLVINSMNDLINQVNTLEHKSYFLEEYLEGQQYSMLSLWDGKSLWYNSLFSDLTEVQQERLKLLKAKLLFLFSDEKVDFMSFFLIKILWAKNDWYILGFEMGLPNEPVIDSNTDLVYLINSAIYQKLHEL